MGERCAWCNTDPDEAAARHEGPHATWCPHFRNEQRGGRPESDAETVGGDDGGEATPSLFRQSP